METALDGAGFEISNPVCGAAGLFGEVMPGATISDLTLAHVDVAVTARPDDWALDFSAGGFAAENRGTITNCGVTGVVAAWRVSEVGGFVGRNHGEIINCYFDGWVLAPWEDMFLWDELLAVHVGGLVSYNRGGGLISNSVSRGTVLGNRGVGGLAGRNGGTIRNGYSQCTVLGLVGAGGLVSENEGHLHTCYAANRVTGELRGGLVGLAGESEYMGSASNCVWGQSDTECTQSGAGVGVPSLVYSPAMKHLALNGWAEDPNWVIPTDPCSFYVVPRLAWEVEGNVIPPFVLEDFAEGSGTEDDPYVINSPQVLEVLSEASILWDKHFVLANDLDVGYGIRPIGICAGSSFSGTFEGNGHVIRGQLLGAGAKWNAGLFGYVTGEVRNLILEDCTIVKGVNSQRVGLLAGTNAGTVTNCFVSGSIEVGDYSQYVGELIGVNLGDVSDCDSLVTIEAGEGGWEVGGLIGADHPPFTR